MPDQDKKKTITIHVDHREAASGIPEQLSQVKNVELVIEQLPLGDYVLSPQLAVERKSAADLAASILDRRLFSQCEQLTETFERVIYLIEGASLYKASNLHPNALRGAISYLTVLAGVTILRSETVEDSALLLATMARHEQHGLGYRISLHPSRKSASSSQRMRYMIEELPRIGPELAEALLHHFGSIKALVGADKDALCQVPGIGPKRAQSIHEILHAPYEG